MVDVIKAYEKYDIDTVSLRPILRDFLLSELKHSKNALGVYAISWRLELKEEAQDASRYLHGLDLMDRGVLESLVARSGDFEALSALWDLRLRREKALDVLIDRAQESLTCRAHSRSPVHSALRKMAREALDVPLPAIIDIQLALGLRKCVEGWRCADFSSACGSPRSEAQTKEDIRLLTAFPQTVFRCVLPLSRILSS